jgi:hypothetical protein
VILIGIDYLMLLDNNMASLFTIVSSGINWPVVLSSDSPVIYFMDLQLISKPFWFKKRAIITTTSTTTTKQIKSKALISKKLRITNAQLTRSYIKSHAAPYDFYVRITLNTCICLYINISTICSYYDFSVSTGSTCYI